MPLYEYVCRQCDQQAELLVRANDPTPTCPACGAPKLMKLLSVPVARTSGAERAPSGRACGGSCACHPHG